MMSKVFLFVFVAAMCSAAPIAGDPKALGDMATVDIPNATSEDAKLQQAAQVSTYTRVVATRADIKQKFGDAEMRKACLAVCDGGHYDSWYIRGDPSDKYAAKYAPKNPTYITARSDQTTWSGLSDPVASSQASCYECDNSANSASTVCHPRIEVRSGTSLTHTTTTSDKTSFSASLSVQVGIPREFAVTAKDTFTVSTTETTGTSSTDSYATTESISVDVTVPAGQEKCAKVTMHSQTYSSSFSIPVDVTGQFRCDYSKPCNKHYFWYGSFDSSFSGTLTGTAHAKTSAHGDVQISDGACHSIC